MNASTISAGFARNCARQSQPLCFIGLCIGLSGYAGCGSDSGQQAPMTGAQTASSGGFGGASTSPSTSDAAGSKASSSNVGGSRSVAAADGGAGGGAAAAQAGEGGKSASAAAGSGGSAASGGAGGSQPLGAGAGGSAGADATTTEPPAACDPAKKPVDAMSVSYTEQGMPPTGPMEVIIETEPSLMGFTIYRPKDLTQRATFPVIVWENGGCSLDGLLFAEFLREIVSNGVVTIVDGTPGGQGMGMLGVDGKTLLQAMDWSEQQNADPCSKYYRKLEMKNIGAMGQSCGGLHAYAVSADPRISTVVIWNSGLLDPDQSILDKLHAPMAYFLGGMDDVAYANGDRDFKDIKVEIPIFYGNLNVGHLATYSQDNGGEFGRVGAAWARWQLLHDDGPDGKGMFSGADCGLCKTDWMIQKKNMD